MNLKILPKLKLLALATAAAGCSMAHAQAARAPQRGELLYTTHCIACHTTQMHWRDGRQVLDWDSLKKNVRRWQAIGGLQWSEADVVEVSRHLNDTIYRFPQTGDRVGAASPLPLR